MSQNIWSGERGFKRASAGALFQGIRTGERDWIDNAVPPDAEVAIVWTGVVDRFVVNQNEFFNRRVRRIYYVGGPTPGGLAETEVRIDQRDGAVRLVGNQRLDEQYVLLDSTIAPDRGVVVAQDIALGLTLWRLDAPLVSSRTDITGLYPNDSWSGKQVDVHASELPWRHAGNCTRKRPCSLHDCADRHGERGWPGRRAGARPAAGPP